MNEESLPNLAELYPASQRAPYWRDRRTLAVSEAVLLSLDVEPLTIQELREITPEDETLHFGQQEDSYEFRFEEVVNAVNQGVLSIHRTPEGWRQIYASEFIEWAKARNWDLPDWLTYRRRRSTRGHATGPTWESEQKTKRLAELAKSILVETPALTKAEIARRICLRLSRVPDGDIGQPSASDIRNRLFYSENAPFKGERWDQLRARAREQRVIQMARQESS